MLYGYLWLVHNWWTISEKGVKITPTPWMLSSDYQIVKLYFLVIVVPVGCSSFMVIWTTKICWTILTNLTKISSHRILFLLYNQCLIDFSTYSKRFCQKSWSLSNQTTKLLPMYLWRSLYNQIHSYLIPQNILLIFLIVLTDNLHS